MGKHKKQNTLKPHPSTTVKQETKSKRKSLRVPSLPVMFLLVWIWAAFWYGDVFRIAREHSFWTSDNTLMYYMQGRAWGSLWTIGQFLLMLYRWPVLGSLLTSILVTGTTYLMGYCLRLRGWWKLVQYLPAAAYLGTIAYLGFDLFFETETGMILGIPFLALLVMAVLAAIIRSFSRHSMPNPLCAKEETPRQNVAHHIVVLFCVLLPMGMTQWMRPYVRVVTSMQRMMMEQDWKGMADEARAHAELSYRQIAAYYAIALVQRGEQGSRLFDIRMDYDDPYIHGFDRNSTNPTNYYLMDCDFYAGLVQTAIHHAMEHLTMNGPSIRSLKLLTKCALMNGEWEVARKYITILKKVPFEGDWIARYEPMIGNMELVDADAEFKMVRLTEPIHDCFENSFTQPVFLGYNAQLLEGKSINALWNSLAVQIYTKTMPQFLFRCQPLQGSTPPESFAEAITLLSAKQPELLQQFPGLNFQQTRLKKFLEDTRPYMTARAHITEKEKAQLEEMGIPPSGKDSLLSSEMRALHAKELFPKYKGYYPYYYFFGNLKATRRNKENQGTSNSGVN